MYKIGEVASMLNVEKVVIFEKLISKAKDIEPHIRKEKGVTYFTEFGVQVMNALVYNLPLPVEIQIESVEQETSSENGPDLSEELISDEDIVRINEERLRIKNEIMSCRNKLIELDGQHKQLDEAMRHYQQQIKEDLDWLRIAEGKLIYRAQHNEH
ncbi:MAG: hypothetical protein JXO44_12660 [Clostridia bacterium]|nr:hypothetical protein [Clostridia bacterium]